MAALSKQKPLPPVPSRDQSWEVMADPIHPMHQELLRRVSEGGAAIAAADPDRLSPPARMAAAFYLGLASWGLVIGSLVLLARLA